MHCNYQVAGLRLLPEERGVRYLLELTRMKESVDGVKLVWLMGKVGALALG